MHAHVKVLDLVYVGTMRQEIETVRQYVKFEVTLLHTQMSEMCSRSNLSYGDFEKNIGMQCMQELFFWGVGGLIETL